MRLLLLEDDTPLSVSYSRRLRTEGFAVDEVKTLRDARAALRDVDYDCLVLDRLVPDGDALDLVADVGDEPDRAPVLVVSGALDASQHRVEGLEAGADDYIPKPVRLDELVIRVRRLTARATPGAPPLAPISLGRVHLDRARRNVRLDGERVRLTPSEYAVFEYLARHRDRFVPLAELRQHCWDRHRDPFARPLHSLMNRLRAIFAGALRFQSLRGAGPAVRVEPEARPD